MRDSLKAQLVLASQLKRRIIIIIIIKFTLTEVFQERLNET